MPVVLSFNGVKVKVNARDHNPPHVHVEGKGGKARFNLLTLTWMNSRGFTQSDLNYIEGRILARMDEIKAMWSEYHGD